MGYLWDRAAGGQILGRRPTPALSAIASQDRRLYLTVIHASWRTVTLGGRPTAMVIYQDLGIDLKLGFEI